jgi:hypothetical protein
MEEIKEKALEKMLQEMNEKHSASEDRIHNWLCDQEDESLLQNILKEGKSIKGSMAYAKSKAQKEAENGVAMIDDEVVYGWVVEYFAAEEVKPVPITKSETDTVVKSRKLGAEEKKAADARAKKRAEEEANAKAAAEEKEKEAALKKAHAPKGQTSFFDDLFIGVDLASGPDMTAESVFDVHKCRECGCTDLNACQGGCYWVEDDLCSQCAIKLGILQDDEYESCDEECNCESEDVDFEEEDE